MNSLEAAIALRDQWSNYHHHKETMATTVALTYIGAGLALPWVVVAGAGQIGRAGGGYEPLSPLGARPIIPVMLRSVTGAKA